MRGECPLDPSWVGLGVHADAKAGAGGPPRRSGGFDLRPREDHDSYWSRRPGVGYVEYRQRVTRRRDLAREYWFELLIAGMAVAAMLELVVRRNSPVAPSTP